MLYFSYPKSSSSRTPLEYTLESDFWVNMFWSVAPMFFVMSERWLKPFFIPSAWKLCLVCRRPLRPFREPPLP